MRALVVTLALSSLSLAPLSACTPPSTGGGGPRPGLDAGPSDAGPADAGGRSDGGVDVTISVDVATPVDGGPLLTHGRIFGGTMWYQVDADSLIAPRLVEAGHGLGTIRYSLARFFETPGLTEAQYTTGLSAAFAANPDLPLLDSFLSHGGRVLFNFYATPAWLQDAATPVPSLCGSAPDKPTARRPPTDPEAWGTKVVEPMVALITARFGPGQSYELWNEPTSCTWLGTTDQFNALYAALAKAVKAKDPTGRVGGPSHADSVLSVGTLNDPPGNPTPFVQRFIEAAAAAHAPVDFITLHAYNVNPATNFPFHDGQLAIVRGWLSKAGLPPAEFINDEWNYSVFEDLAHDNVNTLPMTAAYTAASLLAFDAAGYDDQAGQTMQDSGDTPYEVISQLFATVRVLPRSSYFVSEWLSHLTGPRLATEASSPWVRTAAAGVGSSLWVVAAAFTPHEDMSLDTAGAALGHAYPDLAQTLAPEAVRLQLKNWLQGPAAQPVPTSLAALVDAPRQQALADAKALFDHERAVRTDWGVGPGRTDPVQNPGRALRWTFTVRGLTRAPTKVLRHTMASQHGLTQAKATTLYHDLITASVPIACRATAALQVTLGSTATCTGLTTFCQSAGVDGSGLGKDSACTNLEVFAVEFATFGSNSKTQTALANAKASASVSAAFASAYATAVEAYRPVYDALYARPDLRGLDEDVTAQASFDGGVLTVPAPAEPFSVVALEITR